jgi:hypothetical protein
MSNLPRMVPFQEGADEVNRMPLVSHSGPRRAGVFAARISSTHRHKLAFQVGWTKPGTMVTDSVQDWSIQSDEVQRGAKWHCTHYACAGAGKQWDSKDALIREHGDKRKIEGSHMFYAIGKLPADTVEVADVTNGGPTLPMVVTTYEPHGLMGQARVSISGVGGNTAANGNFTATVTGVDTFTIPRAGNGAFILPSVGKDGKESPKPVVVLRPERPILLSDES